MALYLIFILIGTLIVLLQVFLMYYRPDKIKIETFENQLNQLDYTLSFPDVEEIQNKIATEQYFNFFKELDARARGFSFSFEDFKKTYISSIIPFKESDKTNFTNFYNDVVKSIPRDELSKFLIPNLKVAKVKGIENAFPHTHEDIIVFDKSFYTKLKNYNSSSNSSSNSLKNYQEQVNTLIHEIVHIKQRQNPVLYDDLYRQWGFQSISLQYLKNNLQDSITSRIRLNPDELPHYRFWVWKNQVLPLVIYSSFDVLNINQVNYIGIDWNSNLKMKKKQLTDWTEYNEFFGISRNNYHPIEILAEYYSIYYQELIDKNNSNNTSQGYSIFKNYIKNN
jgi:hypothetical protein